MGDKKLSQRVLLIIIFLIGIVELVFLIHTKMMRIHHLGFLILGLIDTSIAFVKNSDYKWCDFIFTLVYFLVLLCGLIIT